jgi:hypothetical protein
MEFGLSYANAWGNVFPALSDVGHGATEEDALAAKIQELLEHRERSHTTRRTPTSPAYVPR